MDFALVILGFFIFLPMLVLIYIFQQQQSARRKINIESMLRRAGIQVVNEEADAKKVVDRFWLPVLEIINTRLKRAGLTGAKTAARLAIIQVALLVVSVYLLAFQTHYLNGKLILLLIILPFLPGAFVLTKQYQRQKQIKSQFPEMLDTLVRSLQSGHGIDGALSLVAKEFAAPLGTEMKEVSEQLQLGIGMRDILREFQRRVTLTEAQYFVITMIIQRETGGQLSNILEDLSKMMRRRERFQGRLNTLTAESRFTAMFIGGAPIAYLAYKFLFAIDTMEFFLEDPTGQIMLYGSIGLIITGIIILRHMMKIRF